MIATKIKNSLKDYAVSTTKDTISILHFLFPDYKIHIDELPVFILDSKVILVTDRSIDISIYENIDIIILKKSGQNYLNTPEGFLSFLQKIRNVKQKVAYLKDLPEEVFWEHAKLYYFMRLLPNEEDKGDNSTFILFNSLFRSFAEIYSTYVKCSNSHYLLFAGLSTMFLKSNNMALVNRMDYSTAYKKKLKECSDNLPIVKASVLEYIESYKKESDFLAFLYNLSLEGMRKNA